MENIGRYSHHIALVDSRLSDFDGDSLDLSDKEYRDGERPKVMTLTGEELLRPVILLSFQGVLSGPTGLPMRQQGFESVQFGVAEPPQPFLRRQPPQPLLRR